MIGLGHIFHRKFDEKWIKCIFHNLFTCFRRKDEKVAVKNELLF